MLTDSTIAAAALPTPALVHGFTVTPVKPRANLVGDPARESGAQLEVHVRTAPNGEAWSSVSVSRDSRRCAPP